MKTNENDIITKLDTLTKQGQRQLVLKELVKIIKDKPEKNILPALARLANRNHSYVLALRILHGIIKEDREKIAPASNEALNIYASSLMGIGALEEAQECLQRIRRTKDFTEAHLTEAFVYFAQWEYQKSIPVLLKYINSQQINAYQKLVGQINLLSALIATGNLAAARELSLALHATLQESPNYKILLGNCFELRSQIEILENSYSQALELLKESERCLADQPGRYLLYVNKWRAISQLGIDNKDSKAWESLLQVKKEALELKNWETCRDCDFHLARLTQDSQLMQRLLLGTPYPGYHDRIQTLFDISIESAKSKQLEFCPGDPSRKPDKKGWDLNQISDYSFLNSTSWPLLQLMTKDIYRPPRAGVVFTELYGETFFDPFTSPQRLRNSVFRFNDWTREQAKDFKIKIIEGDFILTAPEGVSLVCTQRAQSLKDWQASLKIFKSQNNSRSFTSSDLAKSLGISQRHALNLLKKAISSKKIQKISTGKNSRYIFFSGRRAAL